MNQLKIILTSILLLSAAIAAAEELPVYSAELFYPAENSPDFYSAPEFGGSGKNESAEKELKRDLFREAVFVFSGMIYGFDFRYIPGDKRRNVDDLIEINPINEIRWGDPGLKIRSTRSEGNRNLVQFSYYPEESMRSWIMYWSSGSFPLTGGRGEGDFLKGFAAKKDAVEKGVREAVRNYMRSRVRNKPQKIEGEFIFASPPDYLYAAGIYTASVKIKLNVEKVSDYSIY